MRWVTKIEKDNSKKVIEENTGEVFIVASLYVAEIVLNKFLPFFLGFYLSYHRNIIWLLLFVPLIFINIYTEYDGKNIKIKIVKKFYR